GKHQIGMRIKSRIDVVPRAFDRHLLCAISEFRQETIEILPDLSLVAGDGFNVDELARKADQVHGEQNTWRSGTWEFRDCAISQFERFDIVNHAIRKSPCLSPG